MTEEEREGIPDGGSQDIPDATGADDSSAETQEAGAMDLSVHSIVFPNTPPPGGTVCGFIYVVEPGDTLFFIGQRFGVTVAQIVAVNAIPNPNLIFPGQQLLIPALVYRVVPGDSLFLIGQRFGVSVDALARANRIPPPFTIFPDQLLVVPRFCQVAPPPPPPPPAEPCGVIYIVQPGDTVSGLAARFGVTAQAIINANGLVPPFTIFVGQRLIIPVQAVIYTVQPGDTVAGIAARFGVSQQVIITFNNLVPPFTIFPGQLLTVLVPCTIP